MPADGGHLLLSFDEVKIRISPATYKKFIRRIYGSIRIYKGNPRFCLWIEDKILKKQKRLNLSKNVLIWFMKLEKK